MCWKRLRPKGVLPQTAQHHDLQEAHANTPRNFIPRRFEIGGTLLFNDGTTARQEAPQDTPAKGEATGAVSQQLGSDGYWGSYYPYQPAYSTFPNTGYGSMMGYPAAGFYQDEAQNDGANEQQGNQEFEQQSKNPLSEQTADEFTQNDLLGQIGNGQGFEAYQGQNQGLQYNGQGEQSIESQLNGGQDAMQQYSPNFQQTQEQYATAPLEGMEQSFDPQGYYESNGAARSQETKERLMSEKEEEVGESRFKIPHLSRKNLQGLLGYAKQPYLRGGH
ncbi:uncharacterized protein LOC5513592 isoform X2 [Nematostella vectensis]|uniref:uncharacterized protein LOC5513592 isoform X2 n=1 Tax=Nematostella vectensis TaxID=45351 RepID=UPI002076E185|nr:uncharacterized protein LOC5513592 isoform X2 [Nematostella vectensis]